MAQASSALRLANAQQVLLSMLHSWPVTKPELARRTGLTQVTVGKVVDQLQRQKLVERLGDQVTGGHGRPAQLLAPRAKADLIGIELGVRETAIYRFGLGGEANPPLRRTVPAQTSLRTLRNAWQAIRRELGGEKLTAVLIAVPGVLDTQAPAIVYSPNMHWTEGKELLSALAEDFSAPVFPVHEAQALALGHLVTREASDHFLLVDLGDGIGGTVVANGHLLGGPLPLSGEIGHTAVPGNARRCGCGAMGCVETLAGRAGLLQSFRQHTGHSGAEWQDMQDSLQGAALPIWLLETLDALAIVVAGALNLLGYSEAVFVGDLANLHPRVMPQLSERLAQHTLLGRFGRIECRAAPVRRQLGLLAAAVERVFLPGDRSK